MLFLASCTSRDTAVDKSKLLGRDYRLFQNTPAWQLAKAVEDGDTSRISSLIAKNRDLLTYRDPRFGKPILSLAVSNLDYISVKKLLELGANPNMQDLYFGDSPLMEAVKVAGISKDPSPAILQLLLKYGGDPNDEENGPNTSGRYTPLLRSCEDGNLVFTKILVTAGAKVNAVNTYKIKPLYYAMLSSNPDLVIYLVKIGADYKSPVRVLSNGDKEYITEMLRDWRFDLNSKDYKKKMRLVDLLKQNGMDYRKTPVPKEYLDLPKDYLEKY